jgi:nucleoside-diphosphate-sugar epimerase
MAVVVTGSAGFLGRALVASLAADGVPVLGIDRRPNPGLQVDLLDDDPAVSAALRRADAVFHLAGRPGVRDAGPAADAARVRDNVLATAALLDVVPRHVPLVITSSSSVYGGCPGRPSRENDPLRPLGGYARSKATMERICADRPVALLRLFTVAGEGQRPDMALARWIASVRTGHPLRILGSVDRTRDVTDVRDVVRAIRLAAERDVTGPLNVGTGRPRTLADLAAAVCRVLDAPAELVVEPAGAAEPAATCADTTRLGRTLGFVPATDLDDLVARQVAAAVEPVPVA